MAVFLYVLERAMEISRKLQENVTTNKNANEGEGKGLVFPPSVWRQIGVSSKEQGWGGRKGDGRSSINFEWYVFHSFLENTLSDKA